MRGCCLLVFGASFSHHTGISERKPTIQVDLDPMALGKFHPVDIPLFGDIGVTVELHPRRPRQKRAGQDQPGSRSPPYARCGRPPWPIPASPSLPSCASARGFRVADRGHPDRSDRRDLGAPPWSRWPLTLLGVTVPSFRCRSTTRSSRPPSPLWPTGSPISSPSAANSASKQTVEHRRSHRVGGRRLRSAATSSPVAPSGQVGVR